MNILIAAHYNLNNGDRALLEATINLVMKYLPGNTITVSAYQPELINDSRFNTVGWALGNGFFERLCLTLSKCELARRIFKRFYKLICSKKYIKSVDSADLVLVSGGHHLTDILSVKTYYKLYTNYYVPIKQEKKVILLPQSIGPAKDPLIVKSIEYILNKSIMVAYRDKSSNVFIDNNQIECKKQFVPDLVYCLKPQIIDDEKKEKIVGIALYHSYTDELRKRILPFMMENLTKVLIELIRRDYRIKVIPMDIGDEEFFGKICEGLGRREKEKVFIASRHREIEDLINEFSTVSFSLAYKTHATVFSMICRTPVIAVAYHPKSFDFMEGVGLQEYTIKDTEATYESIIRLVEKLEKNRETIREKEGSGINHNRDLIANYIKEVICEVC